MNFINNAEMGALVAAGMAETEVAKTTTNGVTTTTIYAGAPFRKTVQTGDQVASTVVWKIRRTVIVEDGDTTTVTNTWAEGAWDDRTTLTYKYL